MFQYPSPALRASRAASDPAPIASPFWKVGRLPTVFRAEMAAFNGPFLWIAGKDREPEIVRYCEVNPSWTPPLRRGVIRGRPNESAATEPQAAHPRIFSMPDSPQNTTDVPSPTHSTAPRAYSAPPPGTAPEPSPARRGAVKPPQNPAVTDQKGKLEPREQFPRSLRFSARPQFHLAATDFIAIRLPDCHARIQDTENS
jgi:hypothetical protein